MNEFHGRLCTYLNPRGIPCCTECGKGETLCTCPEPSDLAHKRLTSEEGQFLQAVQAMDGLPRTRLFEELVAEIGLLGMHLARHDQRRTPSIDVIRASTVRAAAILTKLATEGTEEYAYPAG